MEAQSADRRPNFTSSGRSVYQSLCYYDIFDYPLTLEQIQKVCGRALSGMEVREALQELMSAGKIRKGGNYYLLADKNENSIERRMVSEDNLASKFHKVRAYGKLIQKFPFVEAAFISGSVSKGILDEDGDVDFFIIARPGRLWLCRTLLVAFKKIILFNSRRYFCVNYFIDSGSLAVPDKNIFVATEIKSLIPVSESMIAKQFEEANAWTNEFLPNYGALKEPLFSNEIKRPWWSKWMEGFFSTSLGEKADDYFFRMTLARWQKKFPHFNKDEFDLNMRSYKSVSKHHPQGNQDRVLSALAFRMNAFEE